MSSSDSRNNSHSRRLRLAHSGSRDPLDPRDWTPSLVVSPVPRRFCDPASAFGDPSATERVWLPPVGSSAAEDWAEFREAVLQHAICIAVRRRNQQQRGLLIERLARLDDRSNAASRWNAMLEGRRLMSLEDLAFLLLHFPQVVPEWEAVTTLLTVAEKEEPPPYGWDEVDR